jgi:hypothetical protein
VRMALEQRLRSRGLVRSRADQAQPPGDGA